jgi:hypothetical protein
MRDPEMFKYDVRVRDRMLRAGRISVEDINGILVALPDTESESEVIALNQPALDLAAAPTANARQSNPPAPLNDVSDADSSDDEASA